MSTTHDDLPAAAFRGALRRIQDYVGTSAISSLTFQRDRDTRLVHLMAVDRQQGDRIKDLTLDVANVLDLPVDLPNRAIVLTDDRTAQDVVRHISKMLHGDPHLIYHWPL